MIISIIAAMDKKRGIGFQNSLPWAGQIPRDMARFKELTTGHTVIMGRKTFDSIGRALPNRMNIVLTRDNNWNAEGVWHAHSLTEALKEARANGSGEEVFIIGGAYLYREALPLADRMYLTEIDDVFTCDTFFPEYDPLEWTHDSLVVHHADDRNAFKVKFLNLTRKTAI
jgi:dihydrofolate reductase